LTGSGERDGLRTVDSAVGEGEGSRCGYRSRRIEGDVDGAARADGEGAGAVIGLVELGAGLDVNGSQRQVSRVCESHCLCGTDRADGLAGKGEAGGRKLGGALTPDADDLDDMRAASGIVGDDDGAGFGAG